MDFFKAKASLEWLVELGATEAISEAPVNRFELPDAQPKPKVIAEAIAATAPIHVEPVAAVDPADVARSAVANINDLASLKAAVSAFELCELKRGAKTTVFADGNPGARVMVVGEAPGRDEDIAGLPFVGAAGKLLDRMFAAIDMARDASDAKQSIYITNILPWRPPQNREPTLQEIAMMMPFLERHIQLVAPDILILMGNVSCQAMLGRKGITRLRGNWTSSQGISALPMFHPAYLLRNPLAKREAWHDLQMLRTKLSG
jgi:uracil-DNA glycosylase family 4